MSKIVEAEANVEAVEFTEEETKNQLTSQLLMNEKDMIAGLLEAANFKTDEQQRIEIVRGEKLYFAFRIRPLSEDEYDRCKTKHTKYVRNKQLGIKLPEDTNTVKYRAALIYQATIEEDRNKLWDNRTVWKTLEQSGFQIMNGLDVIESVMLGGEKDRIIDAIDKLSGYESNLEEVAKN